MRTLPLGDGGATHVVSHLLVMRCRIRFVARGCGGVRRNEFCEGATWWRGGYCFRPSPPTPLPRGERGARWRRVAYPEPGVGERSCASVMATLTPRRGGGDALDRFLIQRQPQHHRRTVVGDFEVAELGLVAVDVDANVLGD